MYDLIAERKPTRNGFHQNNFGIFKMHTLKVLSPKNEENKCKSGTPKCRE